MTTTPRATAELTARVYDEIHRLAAAYLGRERADHTLQTTALVHEAYLRLIGQRHRLEESRCGRDCRAAMTPEQWERIKQIFDAALDQAPRDRAVFVQSSCGEDSAIRSEVERLLADHERASGFLEPPSHGSGRFALSGSQISGTEAELTGQNISHYQILAKLGEGGMGIVYRAFDTQLLRPVAIKVLSHTALADPESNRRFLREARAASALNHPNIAHVYEVAEAGSMRFIVMEHIEGRTLTATIREGPLDFNRVLSFG